MDSSPTEQVSLLEKNTKAARVKRALQSAGEVGVDNWSLNQITFRYGAVIHRLRQEGYKIDTVPLNPKDGHYKFVMRQA